MPQVLTVSELKIQAKKLQHILKRNINYDIELCRLSVQRLDVQEMWPKYSNLSAKPL
jgi:hypothetical protein